MHHPPLFSVIVTTHARPALLARALASLRAQTLQDFEVILCADEGSEATRAAATAGLRAQDTLLMVPHLRGPSQTRNLGVRVAQGRWICYLDDDDSYPAEHLEQLAAAIRGRSGELCYCNYVQVVEQREDGGTTEVSRVQALTGQSPVEGIRVRNFIPNNAFVLEASEARRLSFDSGLRSMEDWDYLIAARQNLEFTWLDLPGPVVHLSPSAERRTVQSFQHNGAVLDYLSIYRKWPAQGDSERQARAEMLQGAGLAIPPVLL